MKRLYFFVAAIAVSGISSAQHYGGITMTPYIVENFGNWSNQTHEIFGGKRTTFGYAVGYQGVFLPERRFSIVYGLQFSSMYNEIAYEHPINMYHSVLGSVSGITGELDETKNIELPVWLRYNILKGPRKFQPFVGVCNIFAFKVKNRSTFYLEDQSVVQHNRSKKVYALLDLGVGCNYRPNDKWMCSATATYSNNLARKVGLSVSIMRRFW